MKHFVFGVIFIFYFVNHSLSDEIISSIEDNWNQIKSMSGEFEQVDPEGNISNGKFYFLKPFYSKFQYEDKNEDIITNESLMLIVDKEGFQIESYSLGNNILKKLLSNNVKIDSDFKIISFTKNRDFYEILLRIKDKKSNDKIQFTFDKVSLDLKKWEISDEFGNKTVFKFTKIKKNIFISQNLFVVKYN